MVTYSTHHHPPTLLLPGCPIPVPKKLLNPSTNIHHQHWKLRMDGLALQIHNKWWGEWWHWRREMQSGRPMTTALDEDEQQQVAVGLGMTMCCLKPDETIATAAMAKAGWVTPLLRLVRSQDKWDGPKGMAAAVRARPWDYIGLTLKARMQGGKEADLCCALLSMWVSSWRWGSLPSGGATSDTISVPCW